MSNSPIKRNQHLMPLSREHHATLLFAWKLRQGIAKNIDQQRIINYISWFSEHFLATHFKTEESQLFREKNDPMIMRALNEHVLISELIYNIVSDKEYSGIEEIHKLADSIEQHTRFEERELFPHIEKQLSEAELEKIGRVLALEDLTAEENYKDEFWVKETLSV